MTEPTSLDRQLADLVWMMATALRAGYSLPQVLDQLAAEAPEPCASACAHLAAGLGCGLTLNQALTNWQETNPSKCLGEVVAVIRQHQLSGVDLAAALEPVGRKILIKYGTDQAFYPAMRGLALTVGAALPQHVREH